jgi:peptidyl-tRNA hydrolase
MATKDADFGRLLRRHRAELVRLGIHPGHEVRDASSFVLAPMRGLQRKELDSVLDTACQAAESIIAQGVEKAMAAYNRRAPGSTSEEE